MVKTLCFQCRTWVQFLVGELNSHMPRGQKFKTQNRSNIVTNAIKNLKMVQIKKIFNKIRQKKIKCKTPPELFFLFQ